MNSNCPGTRFLPSLLAAIAFAAALQAAAPARAQRYIPTGQPDRPRIKYTDSLVSLNTWCPNRGNTISLHVKPVYVNGQPIGFC